ncbi:MAG TPA: YceI family protein [Flavobacterium sp.]|jgi:polyisoprenoid-binding protein YceI
MKNLKIIAIALLVAFGTTEAVAQTKKVDVSKSRVVWVAKKVTGGHEGTVNLKDGSLTFKGKKLAGGTFTVDMSSLTATDLKAGSGKEKLEGHLKSEDFFATDKYPQSTLVFKKVTEKVNNAYTIEGDLTVKGITKPVVFDLLVTGDTAVSKFNIDRTKYDIKYGSGSFFDNLGDKAIKDEFEVNVSLAF